MGLFTKSKKIKQSDPSKNGLKLVMLGIIPLQFFLIIAFYNSMTAGLTALSEFWLGVNLLVFAALLGVYRYGIKKNSEISISQINFQNEKNNY